MEKIFIASDHAAFLQKKMLVEYLQERFEICDLGTHSDARTDYPQYGKLIAQSVLKEHGRGIALCGSGIGISIQVNRFKGIRGALCRSVEDAKLSRQHNDANILCLGGRSTSEEDLKNITDIWLKTAFEGGRHLDRVFQLDL